MGTGQIILLVIGSFLGMFFLVFLWLLLPRVAKAPRCRQQQ